MTLLGDGYTVTIAGELQREEAPVASLQRVGSVTRAWTGICLTGAVIAEVVSKLIT